MPKYIKKIVTLGKNSKTDQTLRIPTHSSDLSIIESEGKLKINLSENKNVKFKNWAEMTRNLTQSYRTKSILGEGGSPGAVQSVFSN